VRHQQKEEEQEAEIGKKQQQRLMKFS